MSLAARLTEHYRDIRGVGPGSLRHTAACNDWDRAVAAERLAVLNAVRAAEGLPAIDDPGQEMVSGPWDATEVIP